ncbi:hypothetical protein OQA88_13516 [Cercophora sp. LCS_1]
MSGATVPQGFALCPGNNPNNFTCPTTSQACVSLAADTTTLCCPQGASCDKIEAILCDVTLQDPARHPDALLKTLALGSELPKCGSRCCPFGYTCTGADVCLKDVDQSVPPPGFERETRPATSSSSTPRTTTGSGVSPTGSSSGPSESGSPGPSQPEAPTPSMSTEMKILIPVLVVCVLAILVLSGLLWFRKIRSRRREDTGGAGSASQKFEKAELEGGEETEVRQLPWMRRSLGLGVKYELPGRVDIVALPATPLPAMRQWRNSRRSVAELQGRP